MFASDINHPNGGEGNYHCDCSGNATVFTASCSYDRYECASWPAESARAYTVDYSFTSNYANGEATEDSEECLFFRSTCNQVCMGYLEGSFYATIDGARCNSITLCDAASSQDFLLDCSNLVPGLVMDTCNGTGIKGSPFELFEPNIYAASLYESGSCGQRNAIPIGFEASHCEKENTVDDACEQYSNSLKVSNGSGGDYVCDCSGTSVRNFEATCGDVGSECVQSPSSTSKYNVNHTFVTPFRDSVESGEVQECIFFLETCNEICVGWKKATGFYATVDGDQCNSMTLCNTETSDFVLDCRNLLPEALLNTCTGEGVSFPLCRMETRFRNGLWLTAALSVLAGPRFSLRAV